MPIKAPLTNTDPDPNPSPGPHTANIVYVTESSKNNTIWVTFPTFSKTLIFQ